MKNVVFWRPAILPTKVLQPPRIYRLWAFQRARNEIPVAAPCGDMAESFDCLKARKIPFWENLKKKKLTPPILIKIG